MAQPMVCLGVCFVHLKRMSFLQLLALAFLKYQLTRLSVWPVTPPRQGWRGSSLWLSPGVCHCRQVGLRLSAPLSGCTETTSVQVGGRSRVSKSTFLLVSPFPGPRARESKRFSFFVFSRLVSPHRFPGIPSGTFKAERKPEKSPHVCPWVPRSLAGLFASLSLSRSSHVCFLCNCQRSLSLF